MSDITYRTIGRKRLHGAGGIRHGLGWCIIPVESRGTVRCTKCNKPATEAWLVYADVSAARKGTSQDTVLNGRCSAHSYYRLARKMDPVETSKAKDEREKQQMKADGAAARARVDRFLSFVTPRDFRAMLGDIVRDWAGVYGHATLVKRSFAMDKKVEEWLASLPEAERTLAVLGRE